MMKVNSKLTLQDL